MNADEWNKKGEKLWMEDKIQEALTAFSEATKLEPENTAALYNEGAALISLDRYSEGLKIIEKAIILKPRDAVGFVWKAVAEYNTGETGLALSSLDTASSIDPDEKFTKLVRTYVENDQKIVLN